MTRPALRCELCKIRNSPTTPVAYDKAMGMVCCTPAAECSHRQRLARGG